MARTKFSELRKELEARPGAMERLADKRAETLEEIRLYELRHAEAVSQAELAGRLEVTQGAVSKLEHSDDVRVSTLRQYLEALAPASSSWRYSTTRRNDGYRFTSEKNRRHETRCQRICQRTTDLLEPIGAS